MAADEHPPPATSFVPTDPTMDEFFAQYEDAAKQTTKRHSFETYLDITRLHLLPHLRNTKLKDLSREQIQRLYARKRDALVFINGAGKPLNPSHLITRSFKPLLRRAGLPGTTFHAATRHTCCCILLQQGVNPKAVSL